jgi:predicted Zn-dependent protease
MGKPAEAKELQQAFLQKYPKQDQVRFEYCRTLADLGEQDAALRELDALISAAEHPSPDVIAMRLEITESIKETGPELALSWLNRFLEKHPLPVFQEAALRLEIKLGKTSDALRRLDFLVASAARPEALLLKKAEVLHASGQSMRARTAAVQAQQAISRLPDGTRNSRATISLLEKLRVFLPTTSSP